MNTIITRDDGSQYRMAVIYDKTTRTYILMFASLKTNHGAQYTCSSYKDAVNRFQSNCRYYGITHPIHIPTEAEFLGVPESIFPQGSKEVVYAKNRA